MSTDGDKIEVELGEKGGKLAISGSGTARLVHAVADFVSPITQPLGVLGDYVRQFRVYREVTASIVLEQTAAKLRARGQIPSRVPPKVLIPAIEKASLEDPNDQEMIERWSELLAKAADGSAGDQAILIDILSRMSPSDAKLLDDLAMNPVVNIGALSQVADAPFSRRYDQSLSLISSFRGDNWKRLCAQLVIRTETRGSAFVRMFVWDEEEETDPLGYFRKGTNETELDEGIDRLKVLGLIDVVEGRVISQQRYEVSFASVYLSYVGVQLFYSTHDPDISKIPSERANPKNNQDKGSMSATGDTYSSPELLSKVLRSVTFRRGIWGSRT